MRQHLWADTELHAADKSGLDGSGWQAWKRAQWESRRFWFWLVCCVPIHSNESDEHGRSRWRSTGLSLSELSGEFLSRLGSDRRYVPGLYAYDERGLARLQRHAGRQGFDHPDAGSTRPP